TPLFTGGTPHALVRRSAHATPNATHLLYELL
ncbi:dihydrofolate reductase, partial [Streptomyces sp. SID5926]|nr:dihydrofolate reductase [Streptomyces sp. SID5926]